MLLFLHFLFDSFDLFSLKLQLSFQFLSLHLQLLHARLLIFLHVLKLVVVVFNQALSLLLIKSLLLRYLGLLLGMLLLLDLFEGLLEALPRHQLVLLNLGLRVVLANEVANVRSHSRFKHSLVNKDLNFLRVQFRVDER